MSNLIYGIDEKPKKLREWVLYSFQQLMAIFVATVMIANICTMPVDACLFGAGIGTLIYQIITKFKSPIFISSCGATISAVLGAIAIGETKNYLAVFIGGLIILAVYGIFALIVKIGGIDKLTKIFPPIIVGPITIVIGLNLASFISGYTQINGTHSDIGILVAIATMIVIAVSSHYLKGFFRTIPFLIGLLFGYILSIILTITGVAPLVNFEAFSGLKLFSIPDFTFKYWSQCELSLDMIGQVALLFVPVAICALLEHYSDHRVLSNIIGTDLTKTPGLHRTLLGDGVASAIGTLIGGMPNTSYGESIATVGFSRVASTKVITVTALTLIVMSFFQPIQAFINSVPQAVFGGCAMILYGYIAASGLKTLFNAYINLEDNRTLIIISVILTVGVSGIYLFSASFAGVSLAMVLGVILNLILRERKI